MLGKKLIQILGAALTIIGSLLPWYTLHTDSSDAWAEGLAAFPLSASPAICGVLLLLVSYLGPNITKRISSAGAAVTLGAIALWISLAYLPMGKTTPAWVPGENGRVAVPDITVTGQDGEAKAVFAAVEETLAYGLGYWLTLIGSFLMFAGALSVYMTRRKTSNSKETFGELEPVKNWPADLAAEKETKTVAEDTSNEKIDNDHENEPNITLDEKSIAELDENSGTKPWIALQKESNVEENENDKDLLVENSNEMPSLAEKTKPESRINETTKLVEKETKDQISEETLVEKIPLTNSATVIQSEPVSATDAENQHTQTPLSTESPVSKRVKDHPENETPKTGSSDSEQKAKTEQKAKFEPYWFAVSKPTMSIDVASKTKGTIEPGAWYLMIGETEKSYIVKSDDKNILISRKTKLVRE